MDYEEAFNIGSIQLEPRLQEYLRRKKFNEENDIEPSVSEEKDFCITPHDLRIIKRFKQGKTKLYTSKRLARDPHFIKPDTNSFEDMNAEDEFKKDPRYKRLQKKLQSHKEAQKQIRNLDGIDQDYTIFHQTNPYDSEPNKRPQRIAKPYDDPNDKSYDNISHDGSPNDEIMMDSRDLVLGPTRPVKKVNRVGARSSFSNDHNKTTNFSEEYEDDNRGRYCYSPNQRSKNFNTYHHPPRIAYKQRLTHEQVSGGMDHSRDLNDVIGNLDTYNKHLNDTYDYVQSDADLDTHTFTPGARTNTRRETPSSYQAIPFRYGDGLLDVSMEDALRGGIRDSSKKTVGFRNPFENQFDYISPDVSDYRHTVQMWPQNTRGQNREIARPKSSSARQDREMRDRVVGRYNEHNEYNRHN